jgi:hypothetical protein
VVVEVWVALVLLHLLMMLQEMVVQVFKMTLLDQIRITLQAEEEQSEVAELQEQEVLVGVEEVELAQ